MFTDKIVVRPFTNSPAFHEVLQNLVILRSQVTLSRCAFRAGFLVMQTRRPRPTPRDQQSALFVELTGLQINGELLALPAVDRGNLWIQENQTGAANQFPTRVLSAASISFMTCAALSPCMLASSSRFFSMSSGSIALAIRPEMTAASDR